MSSTSNIWKYFDKTENEKAKCKICKKEIGRKDGNTKSMWYHVNAMHGKWYRKWLHPEHLEKSDNKVKKRQNISQFLIEKRTTEQEEADELVARIMIKENNSFGFFDNKDLQKLLSKAYPNIKVWIDSNLWAESY